MRLAILSKEGILIYKLREAPPEKVTFPTEPIYQEDVDNSSAKSKRDCKIRNEQLKSAWLDKYNKMEAAGKFSSDRPWKFCDNKPISFT